MPELAEVEYYRKQWDCGFGASVREVLVHDNRIFRGIDIATLRKNLRGAVLRGSETHGKQMLFRFSKGAWLGIHLGMTGELRVERKDYPQGKHDHLMLRQAGRTLVFTDPRQFGRVRFHVGKAEPAWWADLPVSVLSKQFTREHVQSILARHQQSANQGCVAFPKPVPRHR